jgi:tRNA A37 threonylcarbamoyladenosine modification protein TsaB
MTITLALKEKDVTLVLTEKGEMIAQKKWCDNNDLLERFFPALDELLRENALVCENIEEFLLTTQIPQGYTTARIARTIIKALNFARQSEI